MRALILAAGFGKRLLPYTAARPKPLFTLNNIPVIQHCIEKLIDAGCDSIIINTHHLHEQVENFIQKCNEKKIFPIQISTIYEPLILETGGAVRNVHSFMGNEPFIVINSDIVSSIDIKKVWEFHLTGNCCATLVLHDYPIFNKVGVNDKCFIKDFSVSEYNSKSFHQVLAFTGIQVISPEIFSCIYSKFPDSNTPFSIIELYSDLAKQGNFIKAFISRDIFWQDIGTPESYKDSAMRFMVHDCLYGNLELNNLKFFENIKNITITKLAGDGSDRLWFRSSTIQQNNNNLKNSELTAASFIIADHGITLDSVNQNNFNAQNRIDDNKYDVKEIDSFINIGRHLFSQKIPVPEIKGFDRFAGLVVVEDLGDTHLADFILNMNRFEQAVKFNPEFIQAGQSNSELMMLESKQIILECYRKLCRLAISFSIKGIENFHDNWAFQTPSYSKDMILQKECRYFVEQFLNGYLKQNVEFDDFIEDFEFIADNALNCAFQGLMHRDLQSKNIMVKCDINSAYGHDLKHIKFYFIDFQSARRGPLQYDLASLLIDPYVNLSDEIKETILYECADEIEHFTTQNIKITDAVNKNNDFVNKDAVNNLNIKNSILRAENFITCYRYCALTRNMQMLGAFSNLSMNKGKSYFEKYIPSALENLKKNIKFIDTNKINRLYDFIMNLPKL